MVARRDAPIAQDGAASGAEGRREVSANATDIFSLAVRLRIALRRERTMAARLNVEQTWVNKRAWSRARSDAEKARAAFEAALVGDP